MKTNYWLALLVASSATFVTSCSSPSKTANNRLHGPVQYASKTKVVQVSESTQAIVRQGSQYATGSDQAGASDVTLQEGSLLLVKHKDGQYCDVNVGPATVRLVGTTVLTEKRGSVLRIINVEGRSRVNWGLRAGEYRMLEPGQMLLVDSTQQTLPNPVLVDLSNLVSREEMLSGKFLKSDKLAAIDVEVEKQTRLITSGALVSRGSLLPGDNSLDEMQGQTAWHGSRMVDTTWNTGASGAGVTSITPAFPSQVNGLVTGFLR